jgi:putative sulfotransferase
LRVEIQGRYGIDLFRLEDGQSVPPEVEPFLPERLTVDLLRERGADVNRYVGFCAFLTAQTEQALIDTPPRHLWRLTYEDLVLDPVGQLTALGTFLGFAEPQGWAAKVAHRVRPPAGTRPLEPV